MDFLFGAKPDPVETTRRWKRELQSQSRLLDREIRAIETEERKVTMAIKQAVKKGDMASAKMLARELVSSKRAKSRIHTSKAHLHSVQMTLQSNLATMRIAGCIKKSTEVTQRINNLVKVPQLHQTMMAMQREMEKAGLIEEMVDDMMTLDDDDEVEAEAEDEVEKVLIDITSGLFKQVKTVDKPLPTHEKEPVEDFELNERLDALRS